MFSDHLLATHEIGVKNFSDILEKIIVCYSDSDFDLSTLHHDLSIVACIYEVSLSRVEE